jgi:acyl-homoserine lactone acylase PvdQ
MVLRFAGKTGLASGRVLSRVALAGVASLLLALLISAPARAEAQFGDLSGPAFQILAPGEGGSLLANEFSTDQGVLYNGLTPLRGDVTTSDLEKYYVSEKFGVEGPVLRTEQTPRAGLQIIRDSHDIPHIYGATRGDVMYGSGWVAASDRGLLLALGLGPAYVAALSVPGLNPMNMLLEARSFTPSAEAVSFVAEQRKVLEEQGPKGMQVIEDLENWVEGVNGYEATRPAFARLPTVTVADAIAGFSLIGSIFGDGGGTEVANSEFLARLEQKYGASEGLAIFRDLKEADDPEAPTTAARAFPYDTVPSGPTPGAALVEAGTLSTTAHDAMLALKASRRKESNFLLVGAADSRSGHPIAVMGPQLGYFYPELVFQADLHGPGIDAEGAVAPISPYVFIGRGKGFAWSLTSATSENTQQFLEKLCNPEGGAVTSESDYYEHDGQCLQFHSFEAGYIGAGEGEPAHEVYFKESVHGPISGTVLVHGQPYAIANDRANRGREPGGEVAFSMLDSDEVHNPLEFFQAANHLETTFNMAYVDSRNIAFFSAGRLPVLAPGTDPSLPTFGTGAYDWKGFLSLEQHPHEVDPLSNKLLNWNNKPAPEWGAASENFSYGPLYRVQMYKGFKRNMDEAQDVSIMNRAATEDFRALSDWPLIARVLAAEPALSKQAEEAVQEVSTWSRDGASLLGINRPFAPAAAVLEKLFTPLAEAVLRPVLGNLLGEFESLNGADEGPNSQGSAFESGWYGYVDKDLRALLGEKVLQPYSRGYCGNGDLDVCSSSLWQVIQGGVEELQSEQGPNLSAWRAPEVRITFPPGILPFTMRWTNRSTFQQVIEFTAPEE